MDSPADSLDPGIRTTVAKTLGFSHACVDVVSHVISSVAAERAYGVVLRDEAPDLAATELRRTQRKLEWLTGGVA